MLIYVQIITRRGGKAETIPFIHLSELVGSMVSIITKLQ